MDDRELQILRLQAQEGNEAYREEWEGTERERQVELHLLKMQARDRALAELWRLGYTRPLLLSSRSDTQMATLRPLAAAADLIVAGKAIVKNRHGGDAYDETLMALVRDAYALGRPWEL